MIGLPALLCASLVALVDPGAGGVDPEARPVGFNRDVRPILSDHCWTCHGPDSAAREAGLRLDRPEGVRAALSDGGHAVVPGEPRASALLTRVTTDDPLDRMPPGDVDEGLDGDEIEVLRRWIEQGAEWQDHWAFLPPQDRPAAPVEDGGWAADPLDDYVLARLVEAGLSPAPEADRETLIRRVTFDLTGLPPTPEAIDAFLADDRPGAYERVVERLLTSPHHGERLATEWLDASRYADTNGYHHDDFRTMWPWRDWVVAAFNDNKPYDDFIVEQMAGDLLPEPTTGQLIATGFHRNHGITAEGGALDAEYLVEYAADRVATTSTVFLGLTLECARCHEHKYDPISQEEYYGLFAYFSSIDEQGVPAYASGRTHAFEPTLPAPDARQTAELATVDAALAEAREARDAPDPQAEADYDAWLDAWRQRLDMRWEAPVPLSVEAREATELSVLEDGSVLAGGEHPGTDVHELRYRTEATGLSVLRFDALHHESLPTDGVGRAFHGNAVVSKLTLTAVSLADPERSEEIPFRWAWADWSQDNGDYDVQNLLGATGHGWAVAGHTHPGPRTALFVSERPFGFEGGTELVVRVHYESQYMQHMLGRVRFAFGAGSGPDGPERALPLVSGPWWLAGPFGAADADLAFDTVFGPEYARELDRAARFGAEGLGWSQRRDVRDGESFAVEGERSAFFFARELWTPVPRRLDLSLGSDDALVVFLDGERLLSNNTRRGVGPDQDRLELELDAGRHLLVCKVVNDGGPGGFHHRAVPLDDERDFAARPLVMLAPESVHEPHVQALYDGWRRTASPSYLALTERLATLEAERAAIEAEIPLTMIMREREQRRPTFVLQRGAYDAPDEERPVERGIPAALGALPDDAPDDRLGLARWLVADDNPLVARVAVNRFWQMLFGTGIVATQEDFGSRSEWPSHPDLLDHLAVSFRESGWDVRALLRRMVTSATYRQASTLRADGHARDPDNRLLWRGPRRRLPAEMIRDQALAASGALNATLGGPSVKTYQPDGLWAERAIPGSNTKLFERDSGDKLYRRSLYTFWKRSAPPPQMATFDAPEREFCVVRRGQTNTPLQALVLMNDEMFLELARLLAQRVLAEADGDEARLVRMLRLTAGRRPEAAELALLSDALVELRARYADAPEDAAALLSYGESMPDERWSATELAPWTVLASTALNLHETITLD